MSREELGRKNASLEHDVRVATAEIAARAERIGKLNVAYERFVPSQFLFHLRSDSVIDVQLGDHVLSEMSVMFCDIRQFTTLAEQLTAEETFRFLNSYLSRVGPIVRAHGGFIDKFLGDGFMALFTGGPDDAIGAAMAIQRAVDEYNEHRASVGYQPITVGVGIHTGQLVLGTVGEENRMDTTVVSDVVNTASRLEGLCKEFGSRIIASDATIEALTRCPEAIRPLGNVGVKGRAGKVAIHEVFACDPPDVVSMKRATEALLRAAVAALTRGGTAESAALLRRMVRIAPDDLAARRLLFDVERDRPIGVTRLTQTSPNLIRQM